VHAARSNVLVERRNHTLMNMVRSMLSYSDLPVKLLMEALTIAVHILNWVPNKYVLKTPYELWTGRKLSLRHLRVWGCGAEAKVFNTNIRKLDPKIVSCHFIGYPNRSKGYRFYCPNNYASLVIAPRVDVPFGDNSLRTAPYEDAPIVENTLVHLKWRNLQIMMLCQMMNCNKTTLWIMNKIMSLLGDHSVKGD
jgi:hypothetical protein